MDGVDGEGVAHLLQFLDWANAIGANVNASCGCHITVGVASIIGTNDPQAMSEFARKLAHIARWHAMSLYGQTGTGRHLNQYSHTLGDDVGTLVTLLHWGQPGKPCRASRLWRLVVPHHAAGVGLPKIGAASLFVTARRNIARRNIVASRPAKSYLSSR